MSAFDKDLVESKVLEILQDLDPKYRNLVKSERPDFISYEPSIGVEVTVSDYQSFIDSFNFVGKSLAFYLEKRPVDFTYKKDFKFVNQGIQYFLQGGFTTYENENDSEGFRQELLNFVESFYYVSRNDEVIPIGSFENFARLHPNTKLYHKHFLREIPCREGQIITSPPLKSYWTGTIVPKMIASTLKKNEKFKGYQKFDENNLVLVNITCDTDEYSDFETKIKAYENIAFDTIYIVNYWFGPIIHEICLR